MGQSTVWKPLAEPATARSDDNATVRDRQIPPADTLGVPSHYLGLWLPHRSSMPRAGARKAVWIFALYLAHPDHWTLRRCTMESFLRPPTEPKRELKPPRAVTSRVS
ncbi:hypothetical protein QR685DRAFT_576807 [Neurospora intermedia]|uniref:Uncharacterized protein n=1 Tax=Neurospora intermedia TaxID=5142 RepID=A0ABR3DP00_NEUIN